MEISEEFKHYDLFKRLVVENSVGQAEVEADLFAELINLTSIQPYMFFSHDGIKELVTAINKQEIFRDYILNVTNKTLFEFYALGGNYDLLSRVLLDAIRKISYMETLSDSLVQSMFINDDDLSSLLESEAYVMVAYFIVLHKARIMADIQEKFDIR